MSTIADRLSTGIDGLDAILEGGLITDRSYMLRGSPGAGKTILAFHFLAAGVEAGETCLFINLEEDVQDLQANAASLGFDTDSIEFLDLSPTADVFTEDESYDVFPASEVEQEPLTGKIVDRVREVDPDRVVVDPMTQLRYLTSGEYQFRKQIVGFMRFLKEQEATVLFTTQHTEETSTEDLEFISDGAIVLDTSGEQKHITVPKFRGSGTKSGTHTYRIDGGGMTVFPELRPGDHRAEFVDEPVPSGVVEVDNMLNGGIERGTTTIISGATGVGKTTLGAQFLTAAASRGERAVVYLFEENKETFITRSEAIGMPITEMVERGTLNIEETEALEQSPQEFASRVVGEVEENDASIVMVDGIAGYEMSLEGERSAVNRHLHSLSRYLNRMGITTIFVDETKEVAGEFSATSGSISYLADNIVFLRHLELQGELQKAIGVLKKRTSDFERTLRQYDITSDGITVGGPLRELRGVMTGAPEFVDE